MRIAIAIVSLHAAGGLQRDCMAIARIIRSRGHKVTILTARRSGAISGELDVEVLATTGWSNHGRNLNFSKAVESRCAGRFDRIVGFDKLTGLDVLYCGERSVAARRVSMLAGWLPRRRVLLSLEAESFAPDSNTQVLLVSETQRDEYRAAWNTPASRMTLLPPVIDENRRRPNFRHDGTRERMRATLGVAADQWLWLAVCGQPYVKGLDRTIQALKEFPQARLVAVGFSSSSKAGRRLTRLAREQGVEQRVDVLGIREDIAEIMSCADLLVHPARVEAAGIVILEAIVNGLPVIVSADCGYADHVAKADAGLTLFRPYAPNDMLAKLRDASDSALRARWSGNGVRYGAEQDLFHGLSRAADIILNHRT